MREDDKTFMTCLVLFADFICHLKQSLPMYATLLSSAAVGTVAARAVTLVVEALEDVDVVAEAATEAQVKADPQTNLRLTKSLGFRPTSTTLERSMQSSLQPRRHGFIRTAQSPPQTSAKLMLCRAVRTTLPQSQTTTGASLVAKRITAYHPSTPLNLTQPIMCLSTRRRKPHIANDMCLTLSLLFPFLLLLEAFLLDCALDFSYVHTRSISSKDIRSKHMSMGVIPFL